MVLDTTESGRRTRHAVDTQTQPECLAGGNGRLVLVEADPPVGRHTVPVPKVAQRQRRAGVVGLGDTEPGRNVESDANIAEDGHCRVPAVPRRITRVVDLRLNVDEAVLLETGE